MVHAIEVKTTGGPEVMTWTEIDLPAPGPGEVRVAIDVAGVNFIDTYFRSGLYPAPTPLVPGGECVGRVLALGEGVTGFAIGDRVAAFTALLGCYATEANLKARDLCALPQDIPSEVVAATLLKGCTAEFLIERCGKVQPGWTVLVHAAAGGVGQLLVPWLKHIGAHVLATVGSAAKADMARAAGADHVILYRETDFADAVLDFTDSKGVRVVFDGVGADTWEGSLKCCAPRGLVISYGNASGPVTDVNLGVLNQNGSLFVTRPKVFDYYAEPEEGRAGVARVFDLVRKGVLAADIGQRFAMKDAADAHRALEARTTHGATILLP